MTYHVKILEDLEFWTEAYVPYKMNTETQNSPLYQHLSTNFWRYWHMRDSNTLGIRFGC